jgi:hypothetical protein
MVMTGLGPELFMEIFLMTVMEWWEPHPLVARSVLPLGCEAAPDNRMRDQSGINHL